jgi:Flp pilus assembly protein TadD
MPRRSFLVAGLLVLLATILLYLPLANHAFVKWDDFDTLAENPHVRDPSGAAVLHYWREPFMGLYVPLTYTAWIGVATVQEAFGVVDPTFGVSPRGFHLLSLALHALAAVAVFGLLVRLTRAPAAAAAGALLFAVHPVQVEAVAWASGAKDVLSGALGILALLAYVIAAERSIRRARQGSAPVFTLATVLYLLALLAKPNAVVLALLAGILDAGIVGRPLRRVLPTAGAWLALAVPVALVTRSAQAGAGMLPDVALWQRPLVAADALLFYARKLVWPLGLAPDYGRTPEVSASRPEFLFAWLLPLALGLLAWRLRRTRPWIAVGAAIFVAALAPVLGLLPFTFQTYSTVADHYLYLAMLGPALVLAFELARLRSAARPVARGACAVGLVLLAIATTAQIRVWRSTETLFRHVVAVNPASYQGHLGLAWVAEGAGRPDEAVSHYQAALAARDDLATAPAARTNLGNLLLRSGRHEEGLRELRRAAAAAPGEGDIQGALGAALLALGKRSEAARHLREAVRIEPGTSAYANNLAWVLATAPEPDLRDGPAAVELAERARSLDGDDPGILDTLAAAYAEAGRYEEAVATARRAIDLARAVGHPELVADFTTHLAAYERREPWREPSGS